MSKSKAPAKKTRGRPALDPDDSTVPVVIRMTNGQRDKLNRLGGADGVSGAQWVRTRIDRAREPGDKQ